ncbi:enoyl-CoA hydratase/isomerase family protein [Salinicoccus albus]|uniref:enoyl-CoA hydratase/isomerase family protein n=1 Tax=Salinicoccus albus TaxID=418756 RepID=UPI00035DB607|nr:enoyl-CoA hydratase/isomerase family protein [Salinicoccus albus]
MQTSTVLFNVHNGIGWITLNRPQVLNSLDVDMVTRIKERLDTWKSRSDVVMVCVVGAGEKGLCAGGDIRKLYDYRSSNIVGHAAHFFTAEYMMDAMFWHFPKPVLVYMDGVVMGGGAGISVGASHRIVTEKTKWAMPELNIGFFPDVGSSYFLNRLPGAIGRYLALTSEVIKGEDAVYLGLADYYLEEKDWDELLQVLSEKDWTAGDAGNDLHELVGSFKKTNDVPSSLQEMKEKIDAHFSLDTVEGIIHSLEKSSRNTDDWEDKMRQKLLSKSPTSLKVALKQQQGKGRSYTDCLRMELDMAMNFMNHHDFYEGVRAVLVDKDRSPAWQPAALSDVSDADVASFFEYSWPERKHPLADLE